MLPALLLYTLYVAWPVISTVQASFFDWDGISPEREFIGLKNYVDLFTRDRAFRSSLVNNVLWAVVVVGTLVIVGFVIAYLLSGKVRFRNLYRTAFFLPTTAALVVVAFVWRYIYDAAIGPLNAFLRDVGLGDRPHLAGRPAGDHLGRDGRGHLVQPRLLRRGLPRRHQLHPARPVRERRDRRRERLPAHAPHRLSADVLDPPGTADPGPDLAVNEFGFVFLLSKGGPFHASEVMAYQIYDLSFQLNRTGYAAALTVVLLPGVARHHRAAAHPAAAIGALRRCADDSGPRPRRRSTCVLILRRC